MQICRYTRQSQSFRNRLHQPTLHAFDDSYADKMLVESMHRASRLTLTYILSVSSSVTGALVGMQIPVVDLSRGDADAALTVRSACEKFGFFHGAPSCPCPEGPAALRAMQYCLSRLISAQSMRVPTK